MRNSRMKDKSFSSSNNSDLSFLLPGNDKIRLSEKDRYYEFYLKSA
jgi:hypothetical protein